MFEITATDGHRYAFDLIAAAQGWGASVMNCIEWEIWCKNRAFTKTTPHYFGHQKARLDNMPEDFTLANLRNFVISRAADHANQTVKEWEDRKGIPLYDICKYPDQAVYKESVGNLLRFLAHEMKVFRERIRKIQEKSIAKNNEHFHPSAHSRNTSNIKQQPKKGSEQEFHVDEESMYISS